MSDSVLIRALIWRGNTIYTDPWYEVVTHLNTYGDLLSQSPTISGLGRSTIHGSGNLLSQSPTIFGVANDTQYGSGDLLSQSPTISGVAEVFYAVRIYLSVGNETGSLATGSPLMTISSGVATFSVAQTGNIGAGDRITYNTSSTCFIHSRIDNYQWRVITKYGLNPADVSSATVNSILRCFHSIDEAIGTSGGIPYSTGIAHSDFCGTTNLSNSKITVYLICYRDSDVHDTTAIYCTGFTTSEHSCIYVMTPGRFLGIRHVTEMANRAQHTLSGYPNEGYVLDVDSADACIKTLNSKVEVLGVEFSGTATRAIWHLKSSDLYGKIYNVKNCLIGNTGYYGIVFEQDGAGSHQYFDHSFVLDNAFYGQTRASVYFGKGNTNGYVYNNTFDKQDIDTGYASVVSYRAGLYFIDQIDFGYNVFFGNDTIAEYLEENSGGTATYNYWYNRGEKDEWLAPLETPAQRRTNRYLIQTKYDLFEDPDLNNYRLKAGSELIDTGIFDESVVGFDPPSSSVVTYDPSDIQRFVPSLSIGAFEYGIKFEFTGANIQKVYEDKLTYTPYSQESTHQYGIFNSQTRIFVRPADQVQSNEVDQGEYSKEKKILIQLSGQLNRNRVSNKKIKILYELNAYYDIVSNIIFLDKSQEFNTGLFLQLIGNKQYIFYYDDQTWTFSVGVFEYTEKRIPTVLNEYLAL